MHSFFGSKVSGKIVLFRTFIFVLLLLFLAVCNGVVFGAHTIVTQSGLDPDMEENIEVSSSFLLVASSTFWAGLAARLIAQILLSTQIILSFFFYSWRNVIYGEPNLTVAPLSKSLEHGLRFQAFYFSRGGADIVSQYVENR